MKKNEELERQLFLKQLQINRLLDITQAINNNVNVENLYTMYKSFLNWELGVRRLALLLPDKDGDWSCAVSDGCDAELFDDCDFDAILPPFGNAIARLNGTIQPVLQQFEMIIPVFHKDEAIAYALIGDYDASDFSKVQLITTITNIIAVAIENKRLFKRQIERERFNHEMTQAGKMQRSLVPDLNKLPQNGIFEVAAIYKPHFGVGGDYFDCFAFRDDRYLFVVADIAGKGLDAALLMANFQANLHAIIRRAGTPEEFVRQLNRSVWRVTKSERYITMFLAEIDTKTRRLRYINAGHMPPVLILRGQEPQVLTKGTTILGFFQSLPQVEIGELTLDDEALLVIFTDGITDIRNPQGADFNEDLLTNFAAENQQLGARTFNDTLMRRVEEFKHGEDFPDDITVLTCRFFKPND